MNEHKTIRVCKYCFHEKCVCTECSAFDARRKLIPGKDNGVYIDIDEEIFETVLIFNLKRYHTWTCCSGHKEGENSYAIFYIGFDKHAFYTFEDRIKKYPHLTTRRSYGIIDVVLPEHFRKRRRQGDPTAVDELLANTMAAREELHQLALELPLNDFSYYRTRGEGYISHDIERIRREYEQTHQIYLQ